MSDLVKFLRSRLDAPVGGGLADRQPPHVRGHRVQAADPR